MFRWLRSKFVRRYVVVKKDAVPFWNTQVFRGRVDDDIQRVFNSDEGRAVLEWMYHHVNRPVTSESIGIDKKQAAYFEGRRSVVNEIINIVKEKD